MGLKASEGAGSGELGGDRHNWNSGQEVDREFDPSLQGKNENASYKKV